MTSAPSLEFQDPDERLDLQVAATFQTLVTSIVSEQAGPAVPDPPDSPQYGGRPDAPYGNWPTVATTDAEVSADPITEQ